MKKFIICLLGIFCCMQTVAFASLHTTKVANVESIRSVYGHKDPQEVEQYNQEKLNQEQNKNKDENELHPKSWTKKQLLEVQFFYD